MGSGDGTERDEVDGDAATSIEPEEMQSGPRLRSKSCSREGRPTTFGQCKVRLERCTSRKKSWSSV